MSYYGPRYDRKKKDLAQEVADGWGMTWGQAMKLIAFIERRLARFEQETYEDWRD